MKVLKVEDMHCEMCVKRITEAMNEAKIDFEISLENKTVSVDESKIAQAIEELDDLGFDAV